MSQRPSTRDQQLLGPENQQLLGGLEPEDRERLEEDLQTSTGDQAENTADD